jgi:hypothetical protein
VRAKGAGGGALQTIAFCLIAKNQLDFLLRSRPQGRSHRHNRQEQEGDAAVGCEPGVEVLLGEEGDDRQDDDGRPTQETQRG